MKEQIKQRIQELKTEYESGQKMLTDLESQQSNIKNTLLRIIGAIQVLEELLSQAEKEDDSPTVEILEDASLNS